MSWFDSARETIAEVHKTLPADISFADRKKAVSAAYPWGERRMFPYKMWCKAARLYLAQFDPPDNDKRFPLSPLEKLMRKANPPSNPASINH